MADISVSVSLSVGQAVAAHVDDAIISQWIGDRLNEARNVFIQNYMNGRAKSAPGEYPAHQTGALGDSIDWQMDGPREGALFSDINYAAYLAEGTVKMAPRKMLTEALDESLAAHPDTEELARAIQIVGSSSHA